MNSKVTTTAMMMAERMVAFTLRWFRFRLGSARVSPRLALRRLAAALLVLLLLAPLSHAGGPEYVAGTSYFDSSMAGQPLTWAQGQVNYYTDQGDLSPILPNASANALVANAFSQWTAVPTAALSVVSAGQLAEDVNGSDLVLNSSGIITAPSDIAPSAIGTPVGIVYDYDGTVTDDLLGTGAGDPSQCFWNAAYGGVDNISPQANFLHALVVINGQCALQTSELTDVEYRLVRILGSVLGLGWSQANLNVITGNPPATPDDYAGFPVMHYMDPISCVPITVCYANPYQLAPDDTAALSRLYPVTTQNQSSFPGSQIFSAATASIYGSLYFVDSSGNAAQPMQGVNVVARWIDPSTGLPSGQYVGTSVSGFLFTGNAGNPVTGFVDPLGNPFSEFGSVDPSLEGFYDLAGLQIPNGASSAQFQLTVESLDPIWSEGVCPYDPYQVVPSGTLPPIIVTVNLGGEMEQDILMPGSAQPLPPWAASETWNSPAAIPVAGDWVGALSGYGDVAYFSLPAQANRTLSIAVTALDAQGNPSENKVLPVIGLWSLGDPQGTPPPAFTTSPFNAAPFAMTQLDAQIYSAASFLVGIADWRGDGRPDYQYHAQVLYGDSVNPPRVGVNGGAVVLQGTGFATGLDVNVGTASIPVLAASAGQLLVAVPAQSDGPQTITITDPVSTASSSLIGALTIGAAATDQIILVQGSNPPTPVGTQATYPVIVQVMAADGVTPVSGATIAWSATNNATLSACSGASACSVTTDESGLASSWMTPEAAGGATITATLAPGAYNPTQSVATTLVAISPASGIGVTTPYLWVAQGASVSIPLTARVVSNGAPQSGAIINFVVNQGTGSLSAASATTNSSGYATVTLTLTNFTANVQLSACVAPANSPCQSIYGNAVAASMLQLQPVAGADQVIVGQAFQPLTVRVTDFATPPNPVLGAAVAFQSFILRPASNDPIVIPGEPIVTQPGMPVFLGGSQGSVLSDSNGLASVLPSAVPFTGLLEVEITASTGTSATLQFAMESFPASGTGSSSPEKPSPPRPEPVRRGKEVNSLSSIFQ
jgi:hypothetical protein